MNTLWLRDTVRQPFRGKSADFSIRFHVRCIGYIPRIMDTYLALKVCWGYVSADFIHILQAYFTGTQAIAIAIAVVFG